MQIQTARPVRSVSITYRTDPELAPASDDVTMYITPIVHTGERVLFAIKYAIIEERTQRLRQAWLIERKGCPEEISEGVIYSDSLPRQVKVFKDIPDAAASGMHFINLAAAAAYIPAASVHITERRVSS